MAEVKWIKIDTSVFDNRKIRCIETLPDGDSLIVLWFKILCLAGNVNDDGLVYFTKDIPFTEEMLSSYFNRPLATVQLALRTFQQFGMIYITNNVLCVSNWEKYQNKEEMKRIKEQNRERQARFRESQKQLAERNVTSNVTVTLRNATDKDKEKEKDKDKDKDFSLFWAAYPKKENKANAFKAFCKVKVPVDVLIKSVESWKKSEQWSKENGRFIPMASTWLNGKRWEDELPQNAFCKEDRKESGADLDMLAKKYGV